ncbi:tRNA (adenosine(37)-N6)-threonylcarbamoyltransferase complex dimerization subunit type 1 TsaB [Flavisphingomonas formosensis]|uniref:tRNA (adenosine(37)-N6)-threonylcarbamoyltransferase complex dimerization subunit type 1 TsaB n=1 Tax=Flavisphingomonas formosensis TaxID=861534 RepID=UPI0012F9BB54|nr:tRNA (adenosine(37)-N6)-threonylcarbamoyltransferase complex dimerization subunit type 1 TsaB [Sphingomonas formosensis]
MRTLAIETATAACSVALLDDDRVLADLHEVVGRGHAERLVPMISELPDGGRADRIVVDCGPGSFTGVRVGLAAARALGLAWGVPVHGYSSLALLAAAALDEAGAPDRVAAALIGGHGELFVQSFAASPFRPAGNLASLKPEEAAAATSEALVIGSGAQSLIDARRTGGARDILPRASDVRHLPAEFAALAATPIYGRAPDARPQA